MLHSSGVLGKQRVDFSTFEKGQIQHLTNQFCTVKSFTIQNIVLLPSFISEPPIPEGVPQERKKPENKTTKYAHGQTANNDRLVGSSFQGLSELWKLNSNYPSPLGRAKWPYPTKAGIGHVICSGQWSISTCDACRSINCVCVIRLAFLCFCHHH